MKTDKLFHEYFQLVPQTLFELFQINPGCTYQFTSPVLKESERRMDGLLEPNTPGHPRYFLELQGYPDDSIYWRLVEEIGRFHAPKPELNRTRWHAFLLFLDATYDPGPDTLGDLNHGLMPWLTTGVLSDLLSKVAKPSAALNVLQPLIVSSTTIIETKAAEWISEIQQSPELDQRIQNRLVELLVQFVVQRFSQLSRQEIDNMLQLTPLEQTRAGQELIEMGIEQGIEQGELSILARMISQRFNLSPKNVQERLRDFSRNDFEALATYLWQAESYQDIERWLNNRTPQA